MVSATLLTQKEMLSSGTLKHLYLILKYLHNLSDNFLRAMPHTFIDSRLVYLRNPIHQIHSAKSIPWIRTFLLAKKHVVGQEVCHQCLYKIKQVTCLLSYLRTHCHPSKGNKWITDLLPPKYIILYPGIET